MGWRAPSLFGLRRPRRRRGPHSLTRIAMIFQIWSSPYAVTLRRFREYALSMARFGS